MGWLLQMFLKKLSTKNPDYEFKTRFLGFNVIVVNRADFKSDTANILLGSSPTTHVVMIYHTNLLNSLHEFSLRSHKETAENHANCAKICAMVEKNGGGHACAAGFKIPASVDILDFFDRWKEMPLDPEKAFPLFDSSSSSSSTLFMTPNK